MIVKTIKQELRFSVTILLLFLANALYLGLKTFILYLYFHSMYSVKTANKDNRFDLYSPEKNWSSKQEFSLNALLDKIDSTNLLHSFTPFIWLAILVTGIIIRLIILYKKK